MIELDGSYGEGGGQILRTALMLSVITKKPFSINNIRQGRPNPGLKPEHLSCIKALKELCNAKVEGDNLGSEKIIFSPGDLQKKNLCIDIGTAGSITLVLQSLAIPLILSNSSAKIIGGTDVKFSPSIDYFKSVISPALKLFGNIDVKTIRRGYFNKGGGVVEVAGVRNETNKPFVLIEKEGEARIFGISHAAKPLSSARVAERQADAVKKIFPKSDIKIEYSDSICLGSGISIFAQYNNCILGADSVGEQGLTAEKVANAAITKLKNEIESNAPVDEHLADNLIPIIGLKGGEFKASKVSNHCLTNIYVTEKFLGISFEISKDKTIKAIRSD